MIHLAQATKNLIESLTRQPSQAYLFVGATAAEFARAFVRRLFCPQECEHCPHCIKLAHSTHPDLTWVSKSGKRISIEQVRDLQQKALYPPVEASKKIYVIESVEDLSLEAANSLLKILEDPPRYLVFILLAKSTNILPTILSRCQIVKLPTPPRSQVEKSLAERGLSPHEIEYLLGVTHGALPEDSLIDTVKDFVVKLPQVRQQLAGLSTDELERLLTEKQIFLRREALHELLRRLARFSSAQVLSLAASVSKHEQEIVEFFIQEALYWYRDFLAEQGKSQPNSSVVYALETALWKLQRNANVQLLLESLLFTLRQGLQAAAG